ncbi:D-alanyl-D-alanine carboxypeptidase/D-alanyl-D-alanine endopeptidase [Dyella subtropica]|uniref:D-alanyl-D-alanine carboxypeptidase/D-alanyl-D-alanine endopeptidase n=1 Tax=Dyella subtropica TaxID=2992127 RepID=UPI00225B94D4|nr:D-alanyl-D-alanine carboxypeptidase/D-alanyl-D-alanine-endopeptidase [Dyella subtropica]
MDRVRPSPIALAHQLRDTAAMKVISLSRHCLLLATATLSLLTAVVSAQGVSIQSGQDLAARIDAHIGQPRFAGASWGIAVVSLNNGRTLYAHNADQLFQPASTAKLYTAALTLSELGADYRIPTRLLAGDKLRHGTLDGPLILYGMGDPTLGADASTVDWANQLSRQLAERGIQHIKGDLIADDTYFAGPSMGSGWEAIDLQSWFAVPSSALSVQENQVDVTITPAAREGHTAMVSLEPAGAVPAVVNRMTTSAPKLRNDINLYRAPGDNTLYAFGNIAARSPAQRFKLAAVDPAQLAGDQLLKALARHGIKIQGHLRVLHWPQSSEALRADTSTVAEVLSPPVGEILQRGLKHSQNLYLQNLLLIAGVRAQADAMQGPAPPVGFLTTENWGIRSLRQLLDRMGVAPTASLIEEGTGLSRRDLSTPNAMTQLLAFLAAQSYATTLREALPLAGVDGTLQWRMRNTPAENNVQAKTGSMNLVHCMAGYVTTAGGERLAFAIMLNNYDPPPGSPGASRDVDAIAVMLAGLRADTPASADAKASAGAPQPVN